MNIWCVGPWFLMTQHRHWNTQVRFSGFIVSLTHQIHITQHTVTTTTVELISYLTKSIVLIIWRQCGHASSDILSSYIFHQKYLYLTQIFLDATDIPACKWNLQQIIVTTCIHELTLWPHPNHTWNTSQHTVLAKVGLHSGITLIYIFYVPIMLCHLVNPVFSLMVKIDCQSIYKKTNSSFRPILYLDHHISNRNHFEFIRRRKKRKRGYKKPSLLYHLTMRGRIYIGTKLLLLAIRER